MLRMLGVPCLVSSICFSLVIKIGCEERGLSSVMCGCGFGGRPMFARCPCLSQTRSQIPLSLAAQIGTKHHLIPEKASSRRPKLLVAHPG